MISNLSRARTRIICEKHFWAHLMVKLPLIAKEKSGTLCTDGRAIYYDPQFIETLMVEEVQFGILHEVFHVSFGHLARRNGRDLKLWNEACDHVANLALEEAGERLIAGVLADKKYKGWSAERVYDDLLKQQAQQQKSQQPKKNEQGQGKPAEAGNGEGKAGEKAQGTPQNAGTGNQQGQKSEQQGQGQPAQGQGSQGNAGQPQNGNAKADEKGKAQGNRVTGHFVDPVDEKGDALGAAELEQFASEWMTAVQSAAKIAESYGELPGNLKSLAIDAKPVTNWKQEVRRFLDCFQNTRSNWARPNRRLRHMGTYLPTQTGKKIKPLVIALDTSGSLVSQQAKLLAEVQSALTSYPIQKVIVLHVDSKIRHIDEFVRGDVLEIKESFGGGGTDLKVPFEWIEKQSEQFAGLIYITDLMGPKPADSDIKTLWLSTVSPSRANYWMPKFGHVAFMPDAE